jgi:hypothetical protein
LSRFALQPKGPALNRHDACLTAMLMDSDLLLPLIAGGILILVIVAGTIIIILRPSDTPEA